MPILSLGPTPQQVVVGASKRKDRGIVGIEFADALDCDVEIEKDFPIVIVSHQTLDAEDRGTARAARDRLDMVQALRASPIDDPPKAVARNAPDFDVLIELLIAGGTRGRYQ
jgi:hypothetical protein